MEQNFMKEKKILPLILSMSLPMVISMAVSSLYNIVDSFFVARISEKAMTALSIVFPVQNMVTAIAVGFGVGMNAAIAFFLGAGKQEDADRSAALGIVFSLAHGILLTVLGILCMPVFLRLFTDDSEVLEAALLYSNRALLFTPAITAGICFEKIFQSVGKMKVSMTSMICGCAVNIILDPVMIFGLGGVPAMGIRGAAYATGIAQCVTLIIYAVLFALRPMPVRIDCRQMRWDGRLMGRLYRVGVPAALNMALPSVQISALNGLLSSFSDKYVLILGIYYKLQTFIYLTANGIVQGIRPLVGFNAGAGEGRRVEKIFRTSLILIMGIMLAGSALSWAAPGPIFSLFTRDAETARLGAGALRIISIGFVPSGISVTCSGTLEGLGKGAPSLYISLARFLAVMLPAAFLLSRFLQADGVWLAFAVTEAVTALLSAVILKRAGIRAVTSPSHR